MKKCVCKIHICGTKGTGFFTKIPYKNDLLSVLITNNHVLGAEAIKDGKNISVSLNNEEIFKNIKIDSNRKRYTNENLDVTIIEIKEDIDNINDFLILDNQILNKYNLAPDENDINCFNDIYQNESIYILNYINGKEIFASYGLLHSITGNKINHKCNTDIGSSGSPILLLKNNKVIGVHYGCAKYNFSFNFGTLILKTIFEFQQIKGNILVIKQNNISNNIINKYNNEININKEQNINKNLSNEIKNNINNLFESKKEIKKKIDENVKIFEENLWKIYNEKNEKISQNLLKDLNKIIKSLIIQGKEPLVLEENFFEKLINNEAKNIDNEKYIYIKKNNIKKEINKILINEEKYNNQKIIVDNGSSLLEKFENQLFNIFCDKNEKIQIVDIYKLKKLSTALLIKYKNIKPPLELSKIFFEKNMNINDIDEDTRIKIIMKKSNVYNEINDAQLIYYEKKFKF